jgi:hypothetical protein
MSDGLLDCDGLRYFGLLAFVAGSLIRLAAVFTSALGIGSVTKGNRILLMHTMNRPICGVLPWTRWD